ncbi:MAG: hypothetical protein KGI52_18360 [Burkholderiales bacterium]|nr:hypothetical protein [Burkholderiales bacterium]
MPTPHLPIMVFDQDKLSPSLGYVFDPTWLDPCESLLSMLWKFAHMNRIPGHKLTAYVAKIEGDPYLGIAATRANLDLKKLATSLNISLKRVRIAIGRTDTWRPWCDELRFCTRCMARGYHSVAHQLSTERRCPIHGQWLNTQCICGKSSAYHLDAHVLGAPFRCAHCRRPYSGRTPSFVHRQPLNTAQRAAISRASFGWS